MTLGGIGWMPDMLLFMLLPVLFFGGLILLAVLLIGRSSRSSPSYGDSAALSILEERYARGEITREEFLERRGVLRGKQV